MKLLVINGPNLNMLGQRVGDAHPLPESAAIETEDLPEDAVLSSEEEPGSWVVDEGLEPDQIGRDPDIYGYLTLEEICNIVEEQAEEWGATVTFYQANGEGELIDFIQKNAAAAEGIIINPGALAHYGYSLRDALVDTLLPVIEVHISNVHAREEWRRRSVIAPIARGQISGLGWRGYLMALEFLVAEEGEE